MCLRVQPSVSKLLAALMTLGSYVVFFYVDENFEEEVAIASTNASETQDDSCIRKSQFPRITRAQTAHQLHQNSTPHPGRPSRPHTTKPMRWLTS